MEQTEKIKVHTIYKTTGGTRVPSVTTILGILNKPALLEWAWRCGCDGLDYKAVRDQAADIGTIAHYLVMAHLKGISREESRKHLWQYSVTDVDRAENCFISYLEWEKGNDFKPLMVEQQLVSELYGFGGTIDCVAQKETDSDVLRILIDYKTGKAIYPEMFAQLAAYRELLNENGIDIQAARILRIGRDEDEGFEERIVPMEYLDRQWELFKHCLAIYNIQKEIRKGDKDG